jgi:hypothetical protein
MTPFRLRKTAFFGPAAWTLTLLLVFVASGAASEPTEGTSEGLQPAAGAPLAVATEAVLMTEGVLRDELLERLAPAIVPVEALIRTRFNVGGQGEEQESRIDLLGAVVRPDGLIMIWNSHVSTARLTELMRQAGRTGFQVEMIPVSFEVTLEGFDRPVPARLAATDSTFDLAFLQIEPPPEASLPYIDFGRPGAPRVGDEVVVLHRLGRGFDQAPYLKSARLGGQLRSPRVAWILDGELAGFGLPVFGLDGSPVGALTTIFSRSGEAGGGGRSAGRMLPGLGDGGGASPMGSFVLPAERVAHLIDLAAERVQDLRAQASN